ncbi:class I SAM-dependent methyltransferase [Tsuneonella sp. SYSU-LHT278]|uniref:class I SAM-dependent methyltransferase n=1 Tax=Tsuneonella sediminis TaxID=3416089 RepID=UPI003F793CFA
MNDLAVCDISRATGALFGELWGPYDEKLFEESVALFTRRLELSGMGTEFLKGARALDAGCGGGRNAIAMARLGASQVHGIDIGERGIEDARVRAAGLDNVTFQVASLTDIPFPDAHFDVVWCAGVLMHTADESRVLAELARVLRPGGMIYFLVYATGGMRWPLIKLLRPLAGAIGKDLIDEAMTLAAAPANKRRTFLDDLFVPKFDFFEWNRLVADLSDAGFTAFERWPAAARLDHEHDLAAYRADLAALYEILAAGADHGLHPLFARAAELTAEVLSAIGWFIEQVATGRMDETEAMDRVIGQGHHRLTARRAG